MVSFGSLWVPMILYVSLWFPKGYFYTLHICLPLILYGFFYYLAYYFSTTKLAYNDAHVISELSVAKY